jgi:hypothetical protein
MESPTGEAEAFIPMERGRGRFQEHLLKAGYAVAARGGDGNRRCPHCAELTLVHYKCHQSSEQQVQQSRGNLASLRSMETYFFNTKTLLPI